MKIYIVCAILWIAIIILTTCPHCGWIGGQAISVEHGGVFHYDCLFEVNK